MKTKSRGDILRIARAIENLSLRELSDSFGYDHTYICKMENGVRKVPVKLQLWSERIVEDFVKSYRNFDN